MEQQRSRDDERFILELDFINCLSNPHYIAFLAQNQYFEDPKFRSYLRYLEYWRRPEYAAFLKYPAALEYLSLINSGSADDTFVKQIGDPAFANYVQGQMLGAWINMTVTLQDRFKS